MYVQFFGALPSVSVLLSNAIQQNLVIEPIGRLLEALCYGKTAVGWGVKGLGPYVICGTRGLTSRQPACPSCLQW